MITILESYFYRTVGDMQEGFMNNMSDDQIDQEIKSFQRYAQALGINRSRYDDLIVYSDTADDYIPEYGDVNNSEVLKRISNNAKLIKMFDIEFVAEKTNNGYFYYFRTEDDCENYLKRYDDYREQ